MVLVTVIEYQNEYGRGSSRFSLWNKSDIEANIKFFQEYNQTCENYKEILAELQSLLDPKLNRLLQIDVSKVMGKLPESRFSILLGIRIAM